MRTKLCYEFVCAFRVLTPKSVETLSLLAVAAGVAAALLQVSGENCQLAANLAQVETHVGLSPLPAATNDNDVRKSFLRVVLRVSCCVDVDSDCDACVGWPTLAM